jgi:hypothetical protein
MFDDDLGPEFEIDFLTALFMMDKMPYEAAVEKAHKWFHEARE